MAKKKEEKQEQAKKETANPEMEAIHAALKQHEQAIENFRTSFQNMETKFKNLIERNRLR